MRNWISTLAALAATGPAAWGHYLYVSPSASGDGYELVYSDTPAADARASFEPFDKLRLRGWGGDVAGRDLAASAPEAGVVRLATDLPVAAGSSVYGVVRRGDDFPVLLMYHAKAVKPGTPNGKPVGLALELTPVEQGGGVAFLVTENDKPAMGQEVLVLVPGETHPAVVRTGADGMTPLFSKPGGYSARAYRVAPTPGEYGGRKYQATRHYSTLTASLGGK